MIQFGETVRSFGMGGVRVTDGTDGGAFLWNPASLSHCEGMNLQLFELNLGINGQQAYEEFKDVKLDGSITSYSQLYGKHLWLGAQGYSAVCLPYFGVAVYDQAYIDFMMHNPAFPVLNLTYVNDYAFAIAGAVPLGPASFGITAKRITRLGGPKEIGASTLGDLSNENLIEQFQDEGVAYGLDVGLMLRAPMPFNPTVSLAWTDVGSTAFVKTKGADAPERIRDNLTLGAWVEEEMLLAGFAAGIEYRHITNSAEQLGKKIHMGAEVRLAMFDLRAGFYQGYTTYGVGVDLWLLRADAAIYTVERGAYPGQTPDQRIQVGLSMDFGFDPDFNLTDMGGKKRKLKKRR